MTTGKTAERSAKRPTRKPAADAPPPPTPAKTADKKAGKVRKEKKIRDSFTMPHSEYLKIAEIKKLSLKAGVPVKKSEVLRAGLKVLAGMSAAQQKQALAAVAKARTDRAKKT